MIGFNFSEKSRSALCAGMICLTSATFAAEPAQNNVTAPKPPQIVLTNIPLAGTPPPATPQPPQPVASPAALTNLVFDVETKEYEAKLGEATASFTFHLTNISDVPVHVLRVNASCGCTTAKLPPMPWVIQPGKNEELNATMVLAGKPPGKNTKTLTISSTNGTKTVFVTAIVPTPLVAMTEADRQKNMELAAKDRQSIFKNDCAKCHVDKSKGLTGAALYKESCGICHDSPIRAPMIPDLASLNHPVDANFWRTITAEGKPNSMMPAFAQEHGGPLTKEQIDSLVTYMMADFPRDHKPTPQIIKLPTAIPAPSNQPPRASISPGLPPPPPGIPGQTQAGVLPTLQPIKK